MNTNDLFNPGPSSAIIPEGDAARQAVHSLRGYAYQALVTALAWVDIGEHDRLFLEVAEDYALIAKRALNAVQIKDTEISGSVTLNSESICKAVAAFVDLVERNPDIPVNLRFWTTSEIGTERDHADRPAGMAGLKYWKKVAAGANVSPLRSILESKRFPESVRKFSKSRILLGYAQARTQGHVPQNQPEAPAPLCQRVCWTAQYPGPRYTGPDGRYRAGHGPKTPPVRRPYRIIRTQVKWRIKQHWDYDRETRPQAEERPPGNAGAEDRHRAGDTGEVHRNADQKASEVIRNGYFGI